MINFTGHCVDVETEQFTANHDQFVIELETRERNGERYTIRGRLWKHNTDTVLYETAPLSIVNKTKIQNLANTTIKSLLTDLQKQPETHHIIVDTELHPVELTVTIKELP